MKTKQHDRPRCAMCGKLIRMWTEKVYAPKMPNNFAPVPGWQYTGNQRVVSREYTHMLVSPDGKDWIERGGYRAYAESYYADWKYEKRLYAVYVWDGESYLPTSQYFCSGPCADSFAIAAYRAGYRIKQRSAA